ncbi:MAG: hypothetical protein R3348_08650, partial [Xanthomonadales bacterium]|nr:hypothetical protein [Xanthomonadales bacterium]
ALYIVGGWVLMQVCDVLFPVLDVPERALRYVFFALLAGFPAALVFGWFYDIGPTGIRRTPPAGPSQVGEPAPLRRSDYVILAALLAVVGAIIYGTVGRVAIEPAATAANLPKQRTGPPMVAVLPFTTTAREGDSQFFATGVHDDLLTQLSKLQSLRVISRTSVMEYQDVARNLRQIAAELGADVIMEGGIQVAGEQIRINAQLIDARSDEHLWAETYDRQLTTTNIFEVQSDIARAISESMHTTLTEQDQDQLNIIPTDNMAAYRAYRRAMDMFEEGGVYRNPEYRAALEEAVALDPTFTRAWAELGGHLSYINFWGEPNMEEVERAEEILGIVRELAPDSAEYLMALAYYSLYTLKDYDQAFEVITRAEEKAPSDLKILGMKTWILRRQGRHAERNPVFRKILELNPKDETAALALAGNLVNVHEYDKAAEFLAETSFEGKDFAALNAMLALREHGDFERYISEIIAIQESYPEETHPMERWQALIEVRDFEAAEAMLDDLYDPRAAGYAGVHPDLAGRLLTSWFLGDEEGLQQALDDTYAHFEASRTEEIAEDTKSLLVDLALPAALKGDEEKTLRLIRKWFREAEAADATSYIANIQYACKTLSIVGAAAETVECLRRGFTEPSWIRPFIEPRLPYYDPVRDSPEFRALVAEIGVASRP